MIINKKKLITALSPLALATVANVAVADAETIGHLDTYNDHTELDKAISAAESAGINIIREDTKILVGDANEVRTHHDNVAKYYNEKSSEIRSKIKQYETDVKNRENQVQELAKQTQLANISIETLKSQLSANGQSYIVVNKAYNSTTTETDKNEIKEWINKGKLNKKLKSDIDEYNLLQNSMTSFQIHADAGTIKIQRQPITISSEGEIEKYKTQLKESYRQMQNYIKSNPDGSNKPTYTLYDINVDTNVKAAANVPVKVYNYVADPVRPIDKPTIRYHLFDVRAKPQNEGVATNKEGSVITKEDKKVTAIKDQRISFIVENQELPAQRFDKIHRLDVRVKLPKSNIEVHKDVLKNTKDWAVEYDEESRVVTFKATPEKLLDINTRQNINNGMIGGTAGSAYNYNVPSVDFTVQKDGARYVLEAETLINDEYKVVANTVYVVTGNSSPEKHAYKDDIKIDGKVVYPGTEITYNATWDFTNYKGVNIDADRQLPSLLWADDFPEDIVDITKPIEISHEGEVLYISHADDGSMRRPDMEAVRDLTYRIVDSSELPAGFEGAKGKVLVIEQTGVDSEIYTKFMKTGKKLTVKIPMTVKNVRTEDGKYGGLEFTNTVYQSDFGSVYKSNTVTNTTPRFELEKDATISRSNLTSLDLNKNATSEIEVGSHFEYKASGSSYVKDELSNKAFRYKIEDTFNSADEYNGIYAVETSNEIKFKAGTSLFSRYNGTLSKGSLLTKYTTQTLERDDAGRISKSIITFDPDFLDAIDYDNTTFKVNTFFTAKRIADVDGVTNVFKEYLGDIEMDSNEVVTNSRPDRLVELINKQNEQPKVENKVEKPTVEESKDQPTTDTNVETPKGDDKVEQPKTDTNVETPKGDDKVEQPKDVKKGKTLVIHKPLSSIDEARAFAERLGITNIKSIDVLSNKDGKYIVQYEDEIKPQTTKYEFYTLSNENAVRNVLSSIGMKVMSIEKVNDVFVAHAYKA